jgi:hypothetical protein
VLLQCIQLVEPSEQATIWFILARHTIKGEIAFFKRFLPIDETTPTRSRKKSSRPTTPRREAAKFRKETHQLYNAFFSIKIIVKSHSTITSNRIISVIFFV